MSSGAYGGRKRAWLPLEQELGSCEVLETGRGSSMREECVLHHQAISVGHTIPNSILNMDYLPGTVFNLFLMVTSLCYSRLNFYQLPYKNLTFLLLKCLKSFIPVVHWACQTKPWHSLEHVLIISEFVHLSQGVQKSDVVVSFWDRN